MAVVPSGAAVIPVAAAPGEGPDRLLDVMLDGLRAQAMACRR